MRTLQPHNKNKITTSKDVKKVLTRTIKQDPSDLVYVFSGLAHGHPTQVSAFLDSENGLQWILEIIKKDNSKKALLSLSGLKLYLQSSQLPTSENYLQ